MLCINKNKDDSYPFEGWFLIPLLVTVSQHEQNMINIIKYLCGTCRSAISALGLLSSGGQIEFNLKYFHQKITVKYSFRNQPRKEQYLKIFLSMLYVYSVDKF